MSTRRKRLCCILIILIFVFTAVSSYATQSNKQTEKGDYLKELEKEKKDNPKEYEKPKKFSYSRLSYYWDRLDMV